MEAHDPIALFRRSVERWPHRPALHCGGRTLTYAELDRWSNAVAQGVEQAGAAGQRVAVLAAKVPATYAVILGILKSGCAYLPVAPDAPEARVQAMLGKAGVQWAFGLPANLGEVRGLAMPGEEGATGMVPREIRPEAEAYVLFTSGSTGGPKGVSVARGNVAAYLRHMLTTYAFRPEDRFTQFFELTFDLSVHDLFVCWGAGACLCVPGSHASLQAGAYVREQGITAWFSVPSVAMVMQRMRGLSAGSLPQLRFAFFCGEALPWALANAFRAAAPNARTVNLYGPTEATIAITGHELTEPAEEMEGLVPIGTPFAGSEVAVEQGELWLGGAQVAAGYINDPDATRHAFVQRRGSADRWYRTGDRVRMDNTGVLHFIGRLDDQVKVLGHRVEPAEVDALLAAILGRAGCATVAVTTADTARLVTFIDVESPAGPLLEQCRAQLPPYMVPERIIFLPALPLTAHGKVDRKQLIALAKHA